MTGWVSWVQKSPKFDFQSQIFFVKNQGNYLEWFFSCYKYQIRRATCTNQIGRSLTNEYFWFLKFLDPWDTLLVLELLFLNTNIPIGLQCISYENFLGLFKKFLRSMISPKKSSGVLKSYMWVVFYPKHKPNQIFHPSS